MTDVIGTALAVAEYQKQFNTAPEPVAGTNEKMVKNWDSFSVRFTGDCISNATVTEFFV